MIIQKYTLLEVLGRHWWVALLAFGVALLATPIFRWLAYRLKIVDRPDDLLKPHARPIAYLGGLGICCGLLAGLAGYLATLPSTGTHWAAIGRDLLDVNWLGLATNPVWNALAIAVSCLLITLVGLLDDVRDIRPKTKVLGQVLAAAVLLLGGVGTHLLVALMYPLKVSIPFWLHLPISSLLCLVLVISACNASNLLDGLDGLCGGVTAIIALGFLALAAWLGTWGRFPGTDELRVALCLAMLGGIVGFLPYNIPPASIFMGDAGSMLLGFFVATMIALFSQEGPLRWVIAAVVVFGLPILDTALAVVRRLRAGVSIFTGDRSHLYDQLVDRGMSVKQVVMLFYVLALACAVLGVTGAIALRTRFAVIIYAVVLIVVWTIFGMLGMIAPPPKRPNNCDESNPEQ
jgi:UDP-GlcNAc:undecaprenyl-phosphate/decaprenyl-phosphate GlcNAc-1-phosphate transferase